MHTPAVCARRASPTHEASRCAERKRSCAACGPGRLP